MRVGITAIQFWEKELSGENGLVFSEIPIGRQKDDQVVIHQSYSVQYRQGAMDVSDPLYPKPSDLKVMREDTVASVICARRILESANFPMSTTDEMCLMVANSNFIDDGVLDFETIAKAISEIQHADTAESRNFTLGAGISPLIPLRTLTNGVESFVAQYTQIKGENTTYGSTCVAAGHAVDDALTSLNLGSAGAALVGGSHFANVFSFLNHYLSLGDCADYRESTSAAFFLLESEGHAQFHQREVLLYVESVQFNSWPARDRKFDKIYFGGAFTAKKASEMADLCRVRFGLEPISLFSITGSLGCSELGFLIAMAIGELADGQVALIYIEDVYGSFFCLTIYKS